MTPSSALATVLVDELVRGGVRDVVLCPGSRSAPLAYAILAAERAGRLRLHVRVDERSAAFLALGLALGGQVPVAVATTSGTAVANLHPAVLEAHHAGVPLIVLSADRPHELRGTGANQTTAQPGIFGASTRWSADLPAPVVRPGLGPFWRSTVCRALAAATGATGGEPGPVHLNVALREPLVPDPSAPDWPDSLDGRPDDAPWVHVGLRATVDGEVDETVGAPAADGDDGGQSSWGSPAGGGVEGLVTGTGTQPSAHSGPTHATEDAGLPHVERTLVLVGRTRDTDVARWAVQWAAGRGYPVVAEPFGPGSVRAAALPHGPLVLTVTDWLDAHAPDRVVVVGRATLSRAVGALLRRPNLRVEVVDEGGQWPDPSHVAAAVHPPSVLRGDPAGVIQPAGDWAAAWTDAGRRVADAVAGQAFPWPTGLAVAQVLWATLPDDALLVLGSSNPVRDLDLAAARAVAGEVLANRGLAGIDGIVSTAVGAALANPQRPAYALLGDLTLLHDTNGLLIGPDEPVPDLTLVVVNDDGGGIFTTLEPGAPERATDFERVFGTPTGTDLAALCRAHGIRHTLADDRAALVEALGARPEGLSVAEVPVARATHRPAHADLRALAADALSD